MSEFQFFARCVFNPQMFPDSIQIEVCLGAEAPGAVHDEIITVTHRIICRLYLWATSIQHYRQDSYQREITIGVKLNDIPLEIPASAPWLISLLCSQAATLYITSCGRLMGGVGNPKQHLVYHICNGNSDAFKL